MDRESTVLDSAIIDELDANGAICLRKAFSEKWVDVAAEGIRKNIEQPSALFQRMSSGDSGDFLSDMWARRYVEEFEDFALHSPAASIAAQCLKTDRVRLLQDTWFFKSPGTSERTPWHHDNVVLGPFCSVWVALDPIPREATLEFVRGSHKWDQLLMPKSFFEQQTDDNVAAAEQFYVAYHGKMGLRADGDVFSPVPDIEADRDAYDILAWDMEPGDCIVFHARALHGAPGNTLDYDTRRMVTRWVDETAVLAPHGEPVIKQLIEAGFDVELDVGKPITGEMFPEVRP
ncbi:MAG: phytanoyl-CoA dioxygenase family protein [Pseudomonadota bacterium]